MMAAFVASRLSGLARNIAISYQFGTGRELDAYIAANRIPDLLFQIVAGGAVASAFIPVFTSYIVRDDMSGAWQFVSILFNATLVVMAPLVVLLAIFAPQVVALLAPDFEPATRELAVSMT